MKTKEVATKVKDNTDYKKAKKERLKTNIAKYGVANTFSLIEKPWNKGISKFNFKNIKTE